MNSRLLITIACVALSTTGYAQEQAEPTIAVDYEQQRHDRMLELHRQELGVTTNQWPQFLALRDEIKLFLDEEREIRATLYNIENDYAGSSFYVYLYVPDGGTRAQYEEELARVLEALDAWRHRRFFELTAELARLEGIVSPPHVLGEPLPLPVSDIRELARVQLTRLYAAADRGDDSDRLSAFAEVIGMYQTIAWTGDILSWIVSMGGVEDACEHVLKAHLRNPANDDRWLSDADAIIHRHAQDQWVATDALLDSLRGGSMDFIQRTYTDDGAGSGVFLPERYDQLWVLFDSALNKNDGPFDSRHVAADWFNMYHELLNALAHAKGQAYLDAELAIREHIESVGPRVPAAVDLGRTYIKSIHALRKFEIRVAGTRVVLAIERYRLANDGAVPASLEELGELLPASLRTDPLSGEPWVYRPTPTTTSEFGRDLLPGAKAWPYQLWSRALPGIEQATEWSSDPKNGILITVPLQAPQYDAP